MLNLHSTSHHTKTLQKERGRVREKKCMCVAVYYTEYGTRDVIAFQNVNLIENHGRSVQRHSFL